MSIKPTPSGLPGIILTESSRTGKRSVRQLAADYPDMPDNCLKCALFLGCNSYKVSYKEIQVGNKHTVLIILKCPGRLADAKGIAGQGILGKAIQKLCTKYFPHSSVYMTYAIKCGGNTQAGLAHGRLCSSFLLEDINKIAPHVCIGIGSEVEKITKAIGLNIPCTPEWLKPGQGENEKVEDTFHRVYVESSSGLKTIPFYIEIEHILERIKQEKVVALDLEWSKDDTVHSVGLAGSTWCTGVDINKALPVLREVFGNEAITVVGHNIVADIQRLIAPIGIEIACKFMDTYILKRELEFDGVYNSLSDFNYYRLCLEDYWEGKKTLELLQSPSPLVYKGVAGDAWSSLMLWQDYKQRYAEMYRHTAEARRIDMNMIIPVAYMLYKGIKVDMDQLEKNRQKVAKLSREYEQRIQNEYKINPRSSAQVLQVLNERYGLKLKSTDAKVLNRLRSNELVKLLLDFRQCDVLASRYFDNVIEHLSPDNILRCNLQICGAPSGRMACSNPNMQNFPSELRNMFVSRFGVEGELWSIDAQQSEPICTAYLARDMEMIKLLQAGLDSHTAVAQQMGLMDQPNGRHFAKILNLADNYGSSNTTLENILIDAGKTPEEAAILVAKFKKVRMGLDLWKFHTYKKACERGYIDAPFGRISRRIKFTTAINHGSQSFSADLNKLRLQWLFKEMNALKLQSYIWLEFHDSIEVDVYKPEAGIMKELISRIPTQIPDVYGYGIQMNLKLATKQHGFAWG